MNSDPHYYSKRVFWKITYRVWPPVLRLIELLKIHNSRQDFHIGQLSPRYNKEALFKVLLEKGFELNYIAFKDPGEMLGMRLLDTPLYQYHVRLFSDGEVRGHYEYTPEARPIDHSLEKVWESRASFFKEIMKDYLV